MSAAPGVSPAVGRPPPPWVRGVGVVLTPWQVRIAEAAGRARNAEAERRGRIPTHGARREDAEAYDRLGCCGELAMAVWLNVHWDGSPGATDKATGDVAGYQVRTRAGADWDLYAHDDDADTDVFVLVVGPVPRMRIVGWARGHEVKRRGEWHDRYEPGRPAYWLPQARLHSLRTLPRLPIRRAGRVGY